jgi:ferredoxin-NADP reductase
MEERLRPGATVWLKLPYGNFIIEGVLKEGQGAVLVAGGTGVSPFMPFLEVQLKTGSAGRDVRLYYGVRQNAMLLGADLLGRCATGGIKTTILVEDEEPQLSVAVSCTRGRLDIEAIRTECSAMNDPAFFLSGPPQMIQAFKKALLSNGTAADNIFIDDWE